MSPRFPLVLGSELLSIARGFLYGGDLHMSDSFDGFRPRAKLEKFTAVPNELFDIVMSRLSGNEFKVLATIFRKTYGWVDEGNSCYKIKDEISLSQFIELTGLSKNAVKRNLKKLIKKGYVKKHYGYDAKAQRPACYSVVQKTPPSVHDGPGSTVDSGSQRTGKQGSSRTPQKKLNKEINNKENDKKLSTADLKPEDLKREVASLHSKLKKLYNMYFESKVNPTEAFLLNKLELEFAEYLIKWAGEGRHNQKYFITVLKDIVEKTCQLSNHSCMSCLKHWLEYVTIACSAIALKKTRIINLLA